MMQITEDMANIIIGTHMRRFKRENGRRYPYMVYPNVWRMLKELGLAGPIIPAMILGAWADETGMRDMLYKAFVHYRMTRPTPLIWSSGEN